MSSYEDFLARKQFIDSSSGFDASETMLSGMLFPFQRSIVKWAVKRGRAAIFADTGLGKTFMQVSWAEQVFQYSGNRVLILAPLCVAEQTVSEAEKIGTRVQYVREMPKAGDTGIYITNYEMLGNFEHWIAKGYFDGVVLDESSILKHQDSKTRTRLIEVCQSIPYRLSCTATPSPNDYAELGNQAEFLGVMDLNEMLAMFFIRDGKLRMDDGSGAQEWRLKGHAKSRFWEWLSHWAVFIKKPSDLGFDDAGYDLPPLEIEDSLVRTGLPKASTMSERMKARRETVEARVGRAAELVNATNEPVVVWCNLNAESSQLAAAIPDAVEVYGSLSLDEKTERIQKFTNGQARVIITKPSITGMGLNWQHCARMVFVGLNDSYEDLYQSIRRCYRFGQKRPVQVTLIAADCEGAVRDNIRRKERQAEEMAAQMIQHMREFCRREVTSLTRQKGQYERDLAQGQDFTLHLGDCVDVAREIPDESIDFSVFSPPFASLFTYSNLERDMGNCASHGVFWEQFSFLVRELLRIMKPGRLISVHCCNLTATKATDGYMGIKGFRDELTRLFKETGFIHHSELAIWKDPVVEMQRTKALGLLWKQIKKDSSLSRQGMPDYVVTFRKPGENADPISHTEEEFPVQLWQQLASPVWFDIRQSNTLNRKMAREEQDERHICPLQLDLIERLIFLWSKQGDLVFSPFAGIGSEGYVACAMGRRFIGSELKRSYFECAKQNLKDAPRLGYRFPRFSEKVGDWEPGARPVPIEDPLEQDENQMDWLSSLPVEAPQAQI